MKKALIAVLSAVIFIGIFSVAASAEPESASPPYSYVLMEGSTATLLYEENGSAVLPAHHSAKLMTLLLTAEKIASGELSEDTVLKTSAHANSMQGAQIWLMPGEEITVRELIKSVAIGNANDACVVLAEAVGETEEVFVKLMNNKAAELGMLSTKYVDSTGISRESVTSACDTAILASKLSDYDFLTPYFTTWIDSVRGGKTELASQNRLILNYNGITGMKAYYSKETGNCVIASAERDGLRLVCVIFGETDENRRFTTAKEKLNAGFSAYTLYKPKAAELYPEPVAVHGGEKTEVKSEISGLDPFVVRKSQLEKMTVEIKYYEDLEAPINYGDTVGLAVYKIGEDEVFALKVTAAETVRRMNIALGFRRILGFIALM